jgi:hypothetical protein
MMEHDGIGSLLEEAHYGRLELIQDLPMSPTPKAAKHTTLPRLSNG